MRVALIWPLLVLTILCLTTSAYAHKSSDSYLTLKFEKAHVSGRWDIALRDLAAVVELDDNSDGQLTWGEVRSHFDDISPTITINQYSGNSVPIKEDEN